MIRALVTAALLACAATHFFGTAPDVAIGYGLVLSLTVWYFWPLLCRIVQLLRRSTRRTRPNRTPSQLTATPHLTQINHHHLIITAGWRRARPRRCPDPTTAARPYLFAPTDKRRTTRSTGSSTATTRRGEHGRRP